MNYEHFNNAFKISSKMSNPSSRALDSDDGLGPDHENIGFTPVRIRSSMGYLVHCLAWL